MVNQLRCLEESGQSLEKYCKRATRWLSKRGQHALPRAGAFASLSLLLLLFLLVLLPLVLLVKVLERGSHGHVVRDLVHLAEVVNCHRGRLDGQLRLDACQRLDSCWHNLGRRDLGKSWRRRWRPLAGLERLEAVVVVFEADPAVDGSALNDSGLQVSN